MLLLNRTGDASGVASWLNALPALGRQGVALAFEQSSEFRSDTFEAYYTALLHRQADAAGLTFWVTSNMGIENVRIAFESSAEFFQLS